MLERPHSRDEFEPTKKIPIRRLVLQDSTWNRA